MESNPDEESAPDEVRPDADGVNAVMCVRPYADEGVASAAEEIEEPPIPGEDVGRPPCEGKNRDEDAAFEMPLRRLGLIAEDDGAVAGS